jgi:cytochrome c peroxidase
LKRIRWQSTILFALLALAARPAFSPAQIPNGPRDHNGPPNNRGPGRGRAVAIADNPQAQLGEAIFFDTNLSNPPGVSCASCHSPDAGFSNPSSYINDKYGTAPGAIPTRFGNRKPMTISYSWFTPRGPTFWRRRTSTGQGAWEGGFFSDGRALSLEAQAGAPMMNPNEMDNTLHGLPNSDLVVKKVAAASYANLFNTAFGTGALAKPTANIFQMVRDSLAEFERSREVSPFSSKYDAYVDGETQLTESELAGLRLFTGSITGRPGGTPNYKSAQCVTCHQISDATSGRRDFFTNWTFANIGVPKSPRNPYYKQTNPAADPQGYNPAGDHYIDLGLGAVLYPERGLPPGNIGPGSDGRGDFLQCNGEFRVPSLRNVDKRPDPDFVKCYMHNGFFRTLKQVVHFYNTRNLTNRNEIIDLTSANPYATIKGKPLWPLPEVPSPVTLQNPAGRPNSVTTRVGNLNLTDAEEDDLVAFLQTLSDGYFTPTRRRPPPN